MLIASVSLLMSVALAGCFVLWMLTLAGLVKPGKARRGFEVKPIAGQPPVSSDKERDNDHG